MAAIETFLANGAETTLSSTLSAGATTINVTSSAAFPSTPFYAVIDPDVDAKREVVLVDSSKTATTFVLSAASKRGQDGTTDIEHSAGAKIACVVVAAHFTDLHDRVDGKAATADITSAVNTHAADTTAVHGITDTSALLDTADIGTTVQGYSAVLAATTASFTTADKTKLDGIEAGAQVNATALARRTEAAATTDTLVLADAGKVVRYTAAGAVTTTVPPNSSVAFPTDTVINIYSGGAGGVTIVAGAGVTIRNNDAALAQYDEVSLRKDGTDEWVRLG